MAMENYSPSHPTEEVDLDNSPAEHEIKVETVDKPSPVPEIINEPCQLSSRKSPENPMPEKVDKVRSRSRSCSRKRRRERRSVSRSRRSRSRERRSVSRSRRSRSRDKRVSRSRERRSRSRESRKYSRSRDSPNQYRNRDSSVDRKNDNIFSKMTELSAKSAVDASTKMKWSYDSDDDDNTAKPDPPRSNSFDRYDDMKPLPRRPDYGMDNSRSDDMRPLPRRNDFNNRRGGDNNFRPFGRNRAWEPRNARSSYRNNDNRFGRKDWGDDDDDARDSSGRDNSRESNRENKSFGEGNRENSRENKGFGEGNRENKGFAVGSDEETGSWSAKDKNALSEMLTQANLESQGVRVDNNSASDDRDDSPPDAAKNTFADNSDDEFGAWGAEQKTSTKLPVANDAPFTSHKSAPQSQQSQDSNSFAAADSDEEFGAWGKDQKMSSAASGPPMMHPLDSRDGSATNSQAPFYQQHPRHSFNRFNNNNSGGGNDSGNQRFGGRRGSNNDYNSNNSNNNNNNSRFQRPMHHDRFNNNNYNSNSSYGGGSYGHQKSMHGPQQQPPPVDMMPQLSLPIPPYNFNPTQRPPQWPPMTNMGGMGNSMGNSMSNNMSNNIASKMTGMSFPPMCNGQLPFSNMQLLPQMQFSPMSQQQQQPPMSIPSLMQTMSYIPPPPPSSQQPVVGNININSSSSSSHQSTNYNNNTVTNNNSSLPKVGQNDSNNLLETIMTNVGLSSKSMRLQPDAFKPQPPQQNKSSVSDSLSNIIKSAASTVLSRLVENSQKSANNNNNNPTGNVSDSMSMSPPSPANSPPPPAATRQSFNAMTTGDSAEFILPPLPNYSDILKPPTMLHGTSLTNALMNANSGAMGHNTSGVSNLQSSEISEEKRNRSDFESKGDWQERIALEVKNFLRPAYMSKKINKSDYKEIMKRCVTKISRSGVTEINTEKIEKFVLSYVEKYQKFRRGKQHGVVSSSEHELVM